jgi:hypothetical protein
VRAVVVNQMIRGSRGNEALAECRSDGRGSVLKFEPPAVGCCRAEDLRRPAPRKRHGELGKAACKPVEKLDNQKNQQKVTRGHGSETILTTSVFRIRIMKAYLLIPASILFMACLSLRTAQAQVDDTSKPFRMINGQLVDITPAIKWLNNPNRGRAANSGQMPIGADMNPLPTWGLVQGGKTKEYDWGGWVVRGMVDGKGATFVLKNPPIADLKEFNNLREVNAGLLADAYGQRANASEKSKNAMGQAFRPVTTTEARAGASGYDPEQGRAIGEAITTHASTDIQIREQSNGYDISEEFPVRCLAMRTGQVCDGLPVYDRGVVPNEWRPAPYMIRLLGTNSVEVRSGGNLLVAGKMPAGALRIELAFNGRPGDDVAHNAEGDRMKKNKTIINAWAGEGLMKRFTLVNSNAIICGQCQGIVRTQSGLDVSGTAYIRDLAFAWPCDTSGNPIEFTELGKLLLVDIEGKLAAFAAVGQSAHSCGSLHLQNRDQTSLGETHAVNR